MNNSCEVCKKTLSCANFAQLSSIICNLTLEKKLV